MSVFLASILKYCTVSLSRRMVTWGFNSSDKDSSALSVRKDRYFLPLLSCRLQEGCNEILEKTRCKAAGFTPPIAWRWRRRCPFPCCRDGWGGPPCPRRNGPSWPDRLHAVWGTIPRVDREPHLLGDVHVQGRPVDDDADHARLQGGVQRIGAPRNLMNPGRPVNPLRLDNSLQSMVSKDFPGNPFSDRPL